MSGSRYLLAVLGSALIASALAVGMFLQSLGQPLEAGRWVHESLKIKQEAIDSKNPKVLILAGSNALFGFSAQRMQHAHGVAAVNAAVHAGLGVSYILHYGRQFLAPGRVVVLPLEFELYGEPRLANEALLFQVSGYDPDYFWQLRPADKLSMIAEISPLNRARLAVSRIWKGEHRKSIGYQSHTLDAYGDETANGVAERTDAMLKKVRRSPPKRFAHDDRAWEAIQEFVRNAEATGALVVLAFPNIYRGALDLRRNEEFFRELRSRSARAGISLIGTPSEATFDDAAAFDTVYHQNSLGQWRSTDRLVRDLSARGLI